MKYLLEFADASDTRLKAAFEERLESDTPIPIPTTGAFVTIANHHLRVVRCLYVFWNYETCHVICYCRESLPDELLSECQQATQDI